jgi:AAA ATPase domain
MITRSSPIFVGRVRELRLLDAASKRAANAEPAVVLVGGEASVGKTRLVAELTSRCAADGTRVLVWRLRAGRQPAALRWPRSRPCYGQPTRRRLRLTQYCCGARWSCKLRPSGDVITTQLTRLCTRIRYTRGR